MTNAELAILGLVAEQPRHGYELEHLIESRGMRRWTDIGFSSIYYLLNKLEKQGRLESRIDWKRERGPARKVYSLTPQGYSEWMTAALSVLREPHPVHHSLMLGLANMPGLPQAAAAEALHTYRASLLELRNTLVLQADRDALGAPPAVHALFDLSLTLIDAELNWLERFLEQLA
jgi:DNA-binding PadR family transcriptional regulator